MNTYTILILSLILNIFLLINWLDRWSTKTLFDYDKLFVENEEFRNKIIEERKNNRLNLELNRFARVFMKKFGLSKGMTIFTLCYNIPWWIGLLTLQYYGIIDFAAVTYLLGFYIGGLYVQIWRAWATKKRMKQWVIT